MAKGNHESFDDYVKNRYSMSAKGSSTYNTMLQAKYAQAYKDWSEILGRASKQVLLETCSAENIYEAINNY